MTPAESTLDYTSYAAQLLLLRPTVAYFKTTSFALQAVSYVMSTAQDSAGQTAHVLIVVPGFCEHSVQFVHLSKHTEPLEK